jgi:cation transport ATPase
MSPSSSSYGSQDGTPDAVPSSGAREGPRALRYATFFVAHLECRACARHAELALGEIEGVRSAEVRFLGEMAQIAYDVRKTNDREIARAMQRAGYRLLRVDGAPPTIRHGLGRVQLGVTLLALVELILLARIPADDPAAVGLGTARLALSGIALTLGGSAIAARAWSFAKKGIVGHDATVGAAALGSFALGCLAQWGSAHPFDGSGAFEASAAIIAAALFGRAAYVELCRLALADLASRERARWSAARRAGQQGDDEIVDRHTLAIGDRVHVLEGEIVPADLRLEGPALLGPRRRDGTSSSRQSGEIADAGAVLLSPSVHGRVARPERSELASAIDAEVFAAIGRVERELGGWSTGEGWSDLAAQSLYACTFTFAVFALVVHFSLADGTAPYACLAAIAVVVVASPSAFVLAAPLAATIALARARERGVVVRDPASLDALARVNVACLEGTVTVVHGALEGTLADPLRGDANVAVRGLWQRGIPARMVSGESTEVTQIAGRRLGIPALGELSAEAKALVVRDLQHGGARVLYVHDTKTAVAASHADVAIAIAPAALPKAVDAPILFAEADLQTLPWLVDLARATRRRRIECCAIAVIYNVALVPLAAVGYLSPLEAAALALLESLIVLANAARLLRRPSSKNQS